MPLALGLPAVVTIHDLSFFTHPEWHQRTKVAFFRSAIRTSAQRAAALVAVSATTANLLQDLARPRAPVHVIPHGVDHARFRPDPDASGGDDAARARAGVTQPYVAFVGTLEPRKDVPTLVRAFDRMAGTHPDLALVLAGGRGWGGGAVEEAVAAAAHRDRIRLLGYLDETDLPALLRGAAVVAYPSFEEGFGLPVLEALACGTPVVTTSGTVMEEVAGGAAYLAPPGDVDRLAHALEAAFQGGEEHRALGLEVAARHSWDASAEAHAAVYRSVAG
jgi:glycosyltransferase involved in cell wall biosynthesis